MKSNISKIPKGQYCYTWLEFPAKVNNFKGKVKVCPFWKIKTVDGIEFPWCDYLKLGGTPGCGDWKGWENHEEASEKLAKHFGGEKERDEKLSLFLLFDQCKECDENRE